MYSTSVNIPKRYILVMMAFLGYVNVYYVHTNVGMAIVAMSSSKPGLNESSIEFYWNSKQRALIISSYNYGRLLGPLGGILAGIMGGGTLNSITILIIALISAISPFLLYTNFYLFIVANSTIGFLESVTFSCISQLWSRWAPPNERSKFLSFSVSGIYIGTMMSFLLAGYILKTYHWSVLYYVTGGIGFIWFWIWFLTVSDDPEKHKTITEKERQFIIERVNCAPSKKLIYPWSKIFTCPPILMACFSKFAYSGGGSFILGYLPQYIRDISDLDIDQIGYVSTIPIAFSLSMPFFGCFADYIRKNEILRQTNLHRCFGGFGFCIAGASFVVISFWSSLIGAVICISVYEIIMPIVSMDIGIMIFDLAPRYAAFLSACTNCLFTLGSILWPTFIGFVVTENNSYQWKICFMSFSVFYFLAALSYVKFASGDLRPWANYKCDDKRDNTES